MSTLPAPEVSRLSKPRWLDARLIAGVLLMLLSVVFVTKIVANADDTVPVWALARSVAPGAILVEDDLRRVDVSLSAGMDLYLQASDTGPVGFVATRELRMGELLPSGAVARKELAETRRLTIGVESASASRLTRGSIVDLYVVPKNNSSAEAPGAATLILSQVSVLEVPESGGRLGGGSSSAGVVLSVAEDKVAAVLTATAGGTPTLVEVPKLDATTTLKSTAEKS